MRHAPVVSCGFVLVMVVAAASARAQPTIQSLGNFFASGVSDDGNVVVGTGTDPASGAPGQVMRRWTPGGGLQTAGFAPGSEHTSAHAISGDGVTILGVDYNVRMLVWTQAGGISYPPGTEGFPGDISRDGSVLTGGFVGAGPFRWTSAGGAVALPAPAGWENGSGGALSADGSVVAGTLFNPPGHRRAFRWTATGGTALLDLPSGIVGSHANAISADGSTVVGWAYDATDANYPFRWTSSSGFQLIGGPGFTGAARDATADGSVVVGNRAGPGTGGPFIWDAAHGPRDFRSALAQDYGLDLSLWQLTSVDGVTPDGMTFIGMGSHPQFGDNVAWRVVVPEPGAGVMLVAVLTPLVLRRRRR
jgi:uncharacterized membrane protein